MAYNKPSRVPKQRWERVDLPREMAEGDVVRRRAIELFKHCIDANDTMAHAIASVYLQGIMDGAEVESRKRDRELAYYGA